MELKDANIDLTNCQKEALSILESTENVFLTGGAGTGKSFLIRKFLKQKDSKKFPVLASTGAAAVLVGGRTFHSFFSLGIMEGGVEATIEKALKDNKLVGRLKSIEGFVLDEVSMIPSSAFRAAEAISRLVLDPSLAWGGLQVICVGDFAQLPPISRQNSQKEWCFRDPSWRASQFQNVILRQNMRSQDDQFLKILSDLRKGEITEELIHFLELHTQDVDDDFEAMRLFPRREQVDSFNELKLDEIPDSPEIYHTIYSGAEKYVNTLKKNAPIGEKLVVKNSAFVMLRHNDPIGRFVNGSLGTIREMNKDEIGIELLDGSYVRVERIPFSLLNADGEVVAVGSNFPISLAYASTIHEAQGTTLDRMVVDLKSLWEPGHAYVAVSRVKSPNGLFIKSWNKSSIKVDPIVQKYYDFNFGGI